MGGGTRELISLVSTQKPEPRSFYPGIYVNLFTQTT